MMAHLISGCGRLGDDLLPGWGGRHNRVETVDFADGHRFNLPGGGAAVEATRNAVYLALSLRNVGAGIAVLQAWQVTEGIPSPGQVRESMPPPVEDFLPLARDQYIPAGDIGIWQGALRDSADPRHAMLTAAATEPRSFMLELLYTDQVGGQRTVSLFAVRAEDEGHWTGAVARHWYLDGIAPR
jgi:hypothetical protein